MHAFIMYVCINIVLTAVFVVEMCARICMYIWIHNVHVFMNMVLMAVFVVLDMALKVCTRMYLCMNS
jgi:hypothetical protein